uniref:Ig-like domain-containing protein n=1 Tax=Castor canadensis TaxID=51338 RepID=A0A8C0WLF9_CASCN
MDESHTGEAAGPQVPCKDFAVSLRCLSDWPMTDYVSVSTAHFLEQLKGECHFSNGHVRSVTRYVYNREEFVHFDSDVGEFRAVTELGKPIAKELNSEKDVLDNYRASVDRCRNDYALVDILLLNQRVEPKVTVYPTKTQPLQHHNLMVCSVSGFYPGQIEVRWFQNGQEEEVGVVSTGLIKNGDWTFQILVMLETVPESGEVYTCQVEHPSLKNPVTFMKTLYSLGTYLSQQPTGMLSLFRLSHDIMSPCHCVDSA